MNPIVLLREILMSKCAIFVKKLLINEYIFLNYAEVTSIEWRSVMKCHMKIKKIVQ